MGQSISDEKIINNIQPEPYIEKQFPSLNYYGLKSKGYFSSSVIAETKDHHLPLLIKIFPKPPPNDPLTEKYTRLEDKYKHFIFPNPLERPNFAPILNVETKTQDDRDSIVIIRQYYPFSLSERISSLPELTTIDKVFISFQLLYSVYKLTNRAEFHGNITFNNILLTSHLHVFLADPAVYKPTYLQLSDYYRNYIYFFSPQFKRDTDPVYIAPERLDEDAPYICKYTAEMDTFSTGVVIAQLFMENTLFTINELINYKKGKLNIEKKLFGLKIKGNSGKMLKDLLIKMLDVNPKNRIGIQDALNYFICNICPFPITKFIFHFNIMISFYNYYKGDLLIALISKHWSQIYKCLFKSNGVVPIPTEKFNFQVISELLQSKSIYDIILSDQQLAYCFVKSENDTAISDEKLINHSSIPASKCALIILNYLLRSLRVVQYQSSILAAIELIELLSNQMKKKYVITLIIPYLVSLISCEIDTKIVYDESTEHKFKAEPRICIKVIDTILNFLSMLTEETLQLKYVQYQYFSGYVFKSIINAIKRKEESIKCFITSKLSLIIEIEMKFLYLETKFRYTPKTKSNDDDMMNQSMIRCSFLSSRIASNPKNKSGISLSELKDKYDDQLSEFKKDIEKIIEHIIELDSIVNIQILLIRQLPSIIMLYGNQSEEIYRRLFSKWINSRNSMIINELIKMLPLITYLLGGDFFMVQFSSWLKVVLDNYFYSEATIALIVKLIHVLSRMEFIDAKTTIEFYQQLIRYSSLPNIHIKKEIVDLGEFLISSIPQCDLYAYLSENIKMKFDSPVISITRKEIEMNEINLINRCVCNFIVGNYDINILKNAKLNLFIEKILKRAINVISPEKICKEKKESEVLKGIEVVKLTAKDEVKIEKYRNDNQRSIKSEIESIINKEIKQMKNVSKEYLDCLQLKIIGKLLVLLSKEDNTIDDYGYSKINYLIKSLDTKLIKKIDNISIDLSPAQCVYQEDHFISTQTGETPGNFIDTNWVPNGNLISTYSVSDINEYNQILKLFPIDSEISSFISVLDNGEINYHEIIDNDYSMGFSRKKKINSYIGENVELSKKEICYIEPNVYAESTVVLSQTNSLNFICIDDSTKHNINSFVNNVNIASISRFDTVHNAIITGNEDSSISLFDIRNKKFINQIKYDKGYGTVTVVEHSNDYNTKLLGTSNGFVLVYDFRFNYISQCIKISSASGFSIEGIIPFNAYNSNFDYLPSMKKDTKGYFFIYTNNPIHDISLININTLNCDLMLRVNKSKEQMKIDLPIITNKFIPPFDYSLKYYQRTEEITKPTINANNNCVTCAYPLINGKLLSSSTDGSLRFWDFSKDAMQRTENTNCDIIIRNNQTFSFSNTHFNNTFIIQSNELPSDIIEEYSNHSLPINDILPITKDNENYLLTCSDDGSIKLWK